MVLWMNRTQTMSHNYTGCETCELKEACELDAGSCRSCCRTARSRRTAAELSSARQGPKPLERGLTVGLTCCHFLPKRIGKLEHSLNVYTLTSDTWGTSRGDDCSRRMAKAILMRVRGRSATYDHLRTHFALVYSKLHGKFIR
jgi:hypothetical protein